MGRKSAPSGPFVLAAHELATIQSDARPNPDPPSIKPLPLGPKLAGERKSAAARPPWGGDTRAQPRASICHDYLTRPTSGNVSIGPVAMPLASVSSQTKRCIGRPLAAAAAAAAAGLALDKGASCKATARIKTRPGASRRQWTRRSEWALNGRRPDSMISRLWPLFVPLRTQPPWPSRSSHCGRYGDCSVS